MHVYPIINGKVTNSGGVEINPVYHCNLRCRSCCHMSPVLAPEFEDIGAAVEDFSRLADVYAADYIRVMGGEPLLHPNLPEFLRRLRTTGIGPELHMCTNGALLDSRGAGIWEHLDELEISLYPGASITNEQLDRYREIARDAKVELHVNLIGFFREAYADRGTTDPKVIDRIFRTCQMAHSWRSHTVQRGYFYRCPLSYFLHLTPGMSGDPRQDGLKIGTGEEFRDTLKQFLDSPVGPSACQQCLGTVGKKFDHSQVSRKQWTSLQKGTSEDLLDWEFMAALEKDMNSGEDEFIYLAEGESIPDEWLKPPRRTLPIVT